MPTAAYRGAGRPEATYTIERLIDVAARELGISPYKLRRRKHHPAGRHAVAKTALTFTYDCGEFEGNMQKAAELAELDGFAARRTEAEARGKLRGIGLCNCIEVAGGPFLRPARDQSTLRQTEGRVPTLRSGSMSVGQGLETAFLPIGRRTFRHAARSCAVKPATPTCCPVARAMADRVHCASVAPRCWLRWTR